MKRGSVRKATSEIITLWVPKEVHAALIRAVEVEDTDRSKFVRRAVREKLARLGITTAAKEVA